MVNGVNNMLGYIISLFLGVMIICLSFGTILAHLTWTPPGQLKRSK